MRLTVYTDYSLRMLIYLATKKGGLATIAEVARSYGISEHHLTKVAHQLGVAGYLATVRGKGGGLRLARPAGEIGLGDVVRRTEPDMALVPCFGSPRAVLTGVACPIVLACGLRGALNEATEAFLAVLDRYTLADLVRQRAELRDLLLRPATVRTGVNESDGHQSKPADAAVQRKFTAIEVSDDGLADPGE